MNKMEYGGASLVLSIHPSIYLSRKQLEEANKQLEDKTVYKDIDFKEAILSDLVDKSNRILKSLYTRKFIKEKELKYFSYDFKQTTYLLNYICYLKFVSSFIMYLEDQ